MAQMFVNLPVTDLDRAKNFYTALGFSINPLFTDLPIGDNAVNPSVATAIFLDSREAVDTAVAAGIAAGGSEPRPATDYGFMYQHSFADLDGHKWEMAYVNMSQFQQS